MKRVKKTKTEIQKIIGNECRNFRYNSMRLNLVELSEKTQIPFKTLSNFENGRSSNVHLFYIYLTFLDNKAISKLIDNIFNKTGVM